LDTSIVNSYLISKKLEITQDHKSFRLKLIRQLIKDSINDNNSLKRTIWSDDQSINEDDHNIKKIRVLNSYELPLCRRNDNNHYVEYRKKRKACL